MIDWEAPLDPAETLDYIMNFRGGMDPLLEVGETIASFALNVTAAAAALGLEIATGGGRDPALGVGDTQIKLWLKTDPAFHASPVFTDGAKLGVEATITTTNVPPRIRQRTFIVEVKQL